MCKPYFPKDIFPAVPIGETRPGSVDPAQYYPPGLPLTSDEGIRMMPLPGVRCPTCLQNGQEVWVIPGRACYVCGTPCFA